MKRLIREYRELLPLFWAESPWLVILTFVSGLAMGIIPPFSVWLNSRVFDMGLSVAAKETPFWQYIPYLAAFVVSALLPAAAGDLLLERHVRPGCRLVLHREYKGRMLEKLKRIQYGYLEREDSREIIDKACDRAEDAALFLFPSAVCRFLSAMTASAGMLWALGRVRWQLVLLILIPFAVESVITARSGRRVSDEMERYWKKEKSYTVLGDMLRRRQYLQENYLMDASDYLIKTYGERLSGRNREYEGFYLGNLRRNWKKTCLTRLSRPACALMLLSCYWREELSIGTLVSLTMTVFTGLFGANGLEGLARTARALGKYRNAYDYYDRYFALPEETYGKQNRVPQEVSIEFKDVWFTYPGAQEPVLRGLSFQVRTGEKISLAGENGAGKSTVVKLLLGLFSPDGGSVLIGGKPLEDYSWDVRRKLFGAVFQDFGRYSISLGENVGIGDIDHVQDKAAIGQALRRAGLESRVGSLKDKEDTLLGREFEGGVELSGGQWKRIAIPRAFMGDKPVFILDEPASQLDPMAEGRLYSEFAGLSAGRTALFISHRLGSTRVTDRILVLSGGRITEEGSHEELMGRGGIYARMFLAQRQWYLHEGAQREADDGDL